MYNRDSNGLRISHNLLSDNPSLKDFAYFFTLSSITNTVFRNSSMNLKNLRRNA